jgi:hypothetical protein
MAQADDPNPAIADVPIPAQQMAQEGQLDNPILVLDPPAVVEQ